MRRISRIILVLLFLTSWNFGEEFVPKTGFYKATVSRVHDGDTFYGDCEIWPGIIVKNMGFRFSGVAAPELKETNGITAREVVKLLIPENSAVIVEIIKLDKYSGRVDARIWLLDKNKKYFCLNDVLVENTIFGKMDRNGRKIIK